MRINNIIILLLILWILDAKLVSTTWQGRLKLSVSGRALEAVQSNYRLPPE